MRIIFFVCVVMTGVLYSCLPDEEPSPSDPEYEPVYIERSALKNSVQLTSAKVIENLGRIYWYNDFLFLVKRYEGIHVVNNQDPNNPVNMKFITIPGITNLAIYSGILYCNSATDLLSIKLNALDHIEITDRKENFMDPPLSPNGYKSVVVDRELKGKVLVKWVKMEEK